MADTILHNQPIGTPSDSERIAYGTPSSAAGNITLANFYNLLMTKLGFFKISNLFSEIFGNLTSMATARANLAVPSATEMNTADNLRALKSNVIEKDSTVAFTPTIGTHPVNKGYVDTKPPQLLAYARTLNNGTFDYKVFMPNQTKITTLTCTREGAGSFQFNFNYTGQMRDLNITIQPSPIGYSSIITGGVWKRAVGQVNVICTANNIQSDIELEIYIYSLVS